MEKIFIDFITIDDTIRCYESEINKLNDCKRQVKSAMATINETWSGEAKDAFMKMVNVNWEKNINDYIDKLVYLKKTLVKVRNSYIAINNKGSNLQGYL